MGTLCTLLGCCLIKYKHSFKTYGFKYTLLILFHRSKTAWKGTRQTSSAPWDQEVNLSLGARNSISLCPSKDKC
jgi:hypothetical protein